MKTIRLKQISVAVFASVFLALVTTDAADNQNADPNRDQTKQQDSSGLVYARNIIGQKIQNDESQVIGHIEELILDSDGQVRFAVLVVGKGFLGIGDKRVAIPWEDLSLSATQQGYRVSVSKDALMQAPEQAMANRDGTAGQYQRMSRESRTYQGKVVTFDRNAQKLTIRQQLISHEFKLRDAAQNADIKVGDEVRVTYTKENGENVAQNVEKVSQDQQKNQQPQQNR